MTYRNKKLLASAQGKDCRLQIADVCNGNPETVVWAHINGQKYGKGMGHKNHDLFGFYACHACHAFYDAGAWRHLEEHAKRAMIESLLIACEDGAI
jgi:hypothetical protein